MAKTRIAYTVEEKYRRAFESHAATVGKTPVELFHEMVREYCSDALERVVAAMKVEESMKPTKKSHKSD